MRKEIGEDYEPLLRNNFKKLLDERDISLREFERMSGLRYETIRSLANGTIKQIPLDMLDKICYLLDVGVSDIIDYPVRR